MGGIWDTQAIWESKKYGIFKHIYIIYCGVGQLLAGPFTSEFVKLPDQRSGASGKQAGEHPSPPSPLCEDATDRDFYRPRWHLNGS